MTNPSKMFTLLEQMRNAKTGQRIIGQPQLNLGDETADQDEQRRTPGGEDRDPEASKKDQAGSGESRAKPDTGGIP